LEGGDFYVGVQTKRGCPHNCCYCVYTVVEGKQVRLNPIKEVVAEMRQLYDRGVRGFWFTDAQFIPARRHIEDAKELLRAIQAEGLVGIRWAAYIRADNLDLELVDLMVATGLSYFEIGITSGSQELVRKMRMGYNLRIVLENCRLLARAGFRDHVSVNYSFNVIDERPETIRQTIAYHRELERIFGVDKVEPAIFFIGLQPHTHLEQYGFEQGLIQHGYNPMSMMPWTARKLLWNPEPMGSIFGRICLEAFDTDPGNFGRSVMDLLERDYGVAPLEEALRAPVSGRPAIAKATR
ncbi:MAG TPA: radical SAM protein, partial [Prochlorococcaceae cyanobacterium Gl_MAG_24]|nr:radical SAM protein [Prochlorococcaceae cyanobacterium Gl_MAG_24]